MKIVFTKFTDTGKDNMEFFVNEIRYGGGWLIAIDIVDVGWRAVTPEQYDSFTVTEESKK